ncbi:MAG: hypothetical protein PHS10_01230 [Thiovulaceae bacterium]|jgi:hypothetical protein|nr:hypothetical protein [Sulfurimonadaceae bacterium]
MSGTLTKKEREGLEDVFLSIHANTKKYDRIKEIAKLFFDKKVSIGLENLFRRVKKGIKRTNFPDLAMFLPKTKKHLRK